MDIDIDKDIPGFTNDLEPTKQIKREKEVDKAIEEFMKGLEPPKQPKREKEVDDRMRELLNELEATLKKIWDPPKNR
jgi:DNA-binding transcriptional regulator GbsR (MarR family)